MDEASASIRVSRRCLYHLGMAGEIKFLHRGKKLLFESDSLELWLQKIHWQLQG